MLDVKVPLHHVIQGRVLLNIVDTLRIEVGRAGGESSRRPRAWCNCRRVRRLQAWPTGADCAPIIRELNQHVVDAEGCAHGSLAIAERIPRKSYTRRPIVTRH